MKCPECGAEHAHDVMVCNCGHDFLSPKWREDATDSSVLSVRRLGVSEQSSSWSLRVSEESLILSGPDAGERIEVPKPVEGENRCETELSAFDSLFDSVLTVASAGSTYRFSLSKQSLSKVRPWLRRPISASSPAPGPSDLRRELRKWGIGLIVLGVAHFALAGFLNPLWGGVIIVLGIANLAVPHAAMFVVNGLALMLVGILNIAAGGAGGWSVFGAMQLYWGVKEIRKYSKYAQAQHGADASQHVRPTAGPATVEMT